MKVCVVMGFALAAASCARPNVVVVSPTPVLAAADTAATVDIVQSGMPAAHVDTVAHDIAPLADASRPTAAPLPADLWDLNVRSYETTKRVEHYVQLFAGPAKEHIQSRLERGSQYEAMIRAALKEGGLPEDLYYLGLVESGFDPNAYSKAAAVGMWQFMTSTARDMGLRVDWWIDERRDPERSTRAAVRFIKGLREQFGSLYLAAAAYNGGPGRIERGLSRYSDDLDGRPAEDQFFVLADKKVFRPETRDYVPQLIAVALIGKEPARYGLVVQARSPVAYDSIIAPPGTPLAAIARVCDTSTSTIRDLNPQILRGMTPPGDSVLIRVPVGRAATFATVFDSLPRGDRVGLIRTESKKGESLASVARREGRPTRDLLRFNPKLKRLKSGNLAPGQTILVPSAAVIAAALSVPDPSIERRRRKRG